MSRPIVVQVGPLASAGVNKICLSQTPLAGGNLTINGALASAGVATLDTYRRVLFTFASDETGRTFVVYGTGRYGAQSETVLGAATTAISGLDYLTVTRISVDAATAGALTVGTNGSASSPWVPFDSYYLPQVSIQCTVSGTANYTVQTSMDDPNSPTNPVAFASMTWLSSLDTNAVGASSSQSTFFAYAPRWARITLNSVTGSGNVTGTFAQAGFTP